MAESRKDIPGNQTSEYLVTKYSAVIAAVAPILAVVVSKYSGVDVPADKIVDLLTNALIAISAIAASYTIGRSIVKSRS